MGQVQKIGRLKTDVDGKIRFTRAELREREVKLVEEAIAKTMLAVCGYIMDEPEFDFSDERIAQLWEGVERYLQTINSPGSPYTMKDLAKTVEEHTGIKVVW